MVQTKNQKKKEKIDFKYNLSEYFKFLSKYKWLFLILLLVILTVEASTIADKYLFKIVIDNGSKFSEGLLLKDAFIQILVVVALVFIAVVIIRTVGKWLHLQLVNVLDAGLIYDLKRKYFNHILGLSYSFHTTHKTGSLISRLNRGRSAIEGMTDTILFNFMPLIFQVIVVGITLIYIDIKSAIAVIITIFVFIIYSYIIQNKQQSANLIENDVEDLEKANICDTFTNIESVKYFGKENLVKEKFSNLSNNTKKAMLDHWKYYSWLDAGQALILGIGTFFLIFFPLNDFLSGKLSLGTLVFIYTVYTNLVSSLVGFVWGLRSYYRVMADLNSLFLYGKIENDIKDREDAKDLHIEEGEIEFQNVSFSYGDRKIFDNFNLKIKPGMNVAIVGYSGSGKTSLIKLLYRFYDISSGKILIDKNDIRDVKQETLRSEMSIVPQECILFDDSIYNNILFSNTNASKEDVMKAMKFAQLDLTIEDFPKKEHTIVGERGIKLSGGEKQRVSIARAILADKKILLLDEATSALDSKTENDIQKDLQKLMKGRTSIIIAHRLSTIMKADLIVVMDKGKIVQTGTHEELINKEGEYQKLWSLQKGGYIEQ